MRNLPFVTCLCLTKGRPEWLPGVAASFLRQDYAGRSELLIVADSWDDFSEGKNTVWESCRNSILIHPGTVGEKRNAGVEWSESGPDSVIAIWDDDDYSAPGRLTQQVETLLSTGKAVTGYTGLKFTDGVDWWRFNYPTTIKNASRAIGPPWFATLCAEYVHATSLCFRRDWWARHPFEQLQVGQDERFVLAASAADQLAPCPDLDLMYATIHPGNTSPRVRVNGSLVGSNWEPLPGYVSPHPSIFPVFS